jgi:hypothetical protein
MQAAALGRAIAVALVVVVSFTAVLLREATSPSGAGFWTAMAPAPNGGLYVADEARQQVLRVDVAGARVVGMAPAGIYRALAADGTDLLLGTESGLFVSTDGGRGWRFAIPNRRFTAVAINPGGEWLAGAWDDALYVSRDRGASWARATLPPGDTQFIQIVPGFAATLLGMLHSEDGGLSWSRLPGSGDRMTAVSLTGSVQDPIRAGDWYGRIWLYDAPDHRFFGAGANCGGGVWSVAKSVTATTAGLCPKPRSGPTLLADHEVTRLVLSGLTYYAAVARGAIYVSDNGTDWRFAYQP